MLISLDSLCSVDQDLSSLERKGLKKDAEAEVVFLDRADFL